MRRKEGEKKGGLKWGEERDFEGEWPQQQPCRRYMTNKQKPLVIILVFSILNSNKCGVVSVFESSPFCMSMK